MIDTFPPIITCSCINRYKISCLKSLIYFSICLHIHIKKWSNSRNKKYIQSILSLSIIEFSGLYTSICQKFAIIVSKLVFMNGNIANICRWLCKLDCTAYQYVYRIVVVSSFPNLTLNSFCFWLKKFVIADHEFILE